MTELPEQRPPTPLLDAIAEPADLRQLSETELPELARQLREFLLFSVSQTGGHFGAGLGVVELTVALHYVLNTPKDDLIWDVGHQAYPHKILSGRREQMFSMRQQGGLAPFPSRDESPFDSFGTGHSSTSISAALGMALAKQAQAKHSNKPSSHSVAIIGDGAMTAGMAFEALNHAAHCQAPMLIVLNDNTMSISANEGGFASYLERVIHGRQQKQEADAPAVCNANLFEDLGLRYSGPVDGHDLKTLVQKLRRLLAQKGPALLHVRTQKGRGFTPAMDDPISYHALTKIETKQKTHTPAPIPAPKYQDIFGRWICKQAELDPKLIAITPAMREGSGLVEFSQRFADRYYDVAIAEQHALTFAAGLACQQQKPVVAIYSTFLQRAYDQLIHDIALQKLDVLFAIDRAGLVGEDGASHHGSFDISFLNCVPNIIIACPSSASECEQLLSAAYAHPGPAAVRYPRGRCANVQSQASTEKAIGKAHELRQGQNCCLLNFGSLLGESQLQELALEKNWGLVDMRWIKPFDKDLLKRLARSYKHFVSIEDGAQLGGIGSSVNQWLQQEKMNVAMLNLGYKDQFVEHGKRKELLAKLGLSQTQICQQIETWLEP
ncbi:1-deoxy-D-xylulose-5-phosphate synthase [Agaribacterium sp. ZY112]|uniref:1-deoxy-D-xylulose-5-phosphate synthase n=1 Tax=Agaribacterium sp. ZY112 TaxID=3233574 RepID=UPI0035265280